jgi:glycosyltransferase involved in cell wall biosynthesis
MSTFSVTLPSDQEPVTQGDGPSKKPRTVLILMGTYLPGYAGGGPIQSIANLVKYLGREYEFLIVTHDQDGPAAAPYQGIRAGQWTTVGNAKVLYLPRTLLGLVALTKCIIGLSYDVLYLNGVFDRWHTLSALILWSVGLAHPGRVIIAPRGEFSNGALRLKRWRKKSYLWIIKRFVAENVIWHASSEYERIDIQKVLSGRLQSFIAAPINEGPRSSELKDDDHAIKTALDLTTNDLGATRASDLEKTPGRLELAFVSRISPMKNLDYDLRVLQGQLKGEVAFHIYGPIDDPQYWGRCEKLITSLPSNISAIYHGPVPHEDVTSTLQRHHLLFVPTLGENYGHIFAEALMAGRPILTSDQTLWRDLAAHGAGWDVPLSRPDMFQLILQKCIDMNNGEFIELTRRAREYAERKIDIRKILQDNRDLFDYSI